ncbi:MAG: iron deficiency-induced protein A [Candidatus Mesenet longicola]|uniref:Iron deficiency-induced protein A n=1 Tax=Candidatus Mesenet longicola TaxID=1892558 RepID=A0A8J3MLT4_9RICK|nr:MAG: iron deficiency-induced protein A [Candidatus Mesenet longicola]GHM59254.1 MAG: iron deficiency-induced protein A [Candidatus Mesenet longicola]
MRKFFITIVILLITLILIYFQNQRLNSSDEVINVYSTRKEELMHSLFDEFTKETGIRINYINDDYAQLLIRIENENNGDLFLTADVTNLISAKRRELLSKIESKILEDVIPENFRDSDNYWFGLTKRARILVYNKELIDAGDLSTYEDLADPKWKGKILTRSSSSPYNQSLIAFMIATNGLEYTKEWIKGLVYNFARKPSGGDTDQIYAVAAGEGAVAIVNSYYFARVLASDKASEKLKVFFPNQNSNGAMINISGGAVIKNAKNKDNAIKLLEFLVSKKAQHLYTEMNHEYPIRDDVEVSQILKAWGHYKQSDLPLQELDKHLNESIMIADQCGWK